jgi:ABC-type antimicrobial peptide transport system permease subunit
MFFQLKINLRNLRRGGIYTAINIGGLAIGMAASIIIMLWVYHQWSFDRFHAKDKYLYKLWCYDETHGNFANVSYSIGPSLLEEYAGFANMSRYSETEVPFTISGDDDGHSVYSPGTSNHLIAAVADTGFLNMFSFQMLRGDPSTALLDPYSMVLTQSAARRIFGDKDPMGETFLAFNVLNFQITGILADLPENSNFGFDILIPYKRTDPDESWWYPSGNASFDQRTFVELAPGVDVKTVSANIRDIIAKHTDGRVDTETYLQHISKWHLYNQVDKGISVGGRIETIRMFFLIALVILAIACINFMNLCTAQSSKYAKEVGVRKVLGARRFSLVFRFLGESTLIAVIAGVCALYLILIFLPLFNAMAGEKLNINIGNGVFWMAWALLVLITGVLAGSYPSFYLSSFRPVKVLKGVFKVGNGLVTPRKALIVTQFTFAIVLIVSTFVIHRQIRYAQTRDTGYNKERLVSIKIPDQERKKLEPLYYELRESNFVEAVSVNFASMFESEDRRTDHLRWSGKDPGLQITFERNYAVADWAKTTGVQIVQGRDIDIFEFPADSTAMLLNETAVKIMGFDNPIGEIVYEWNRPYHVVGVVKDFVLESPYDPIRPMVIGGPKGSFNNINIKLSAHRTLAENLELLEEIYRKYCPGNPIRLSIVDEMYARRFDKEQRVRSLVSWFAGLAVFISCLGLFGLSAYMAENRRKEIGIRKILGASIFDIVSLLSKEFLILITVSLAIALPVAWWVMNQWLDGYAYRTDIPWWLLVAVAGLTIGIAVITVGWQAIKAATANPVKAIKSE